MGVLTFPLRGLLWIAQEVARQAERALYDEDVLRAAMVRLYAALQAGTISEDEFARQEDELAGRLAEAESRRRAATAARRENIDART